MGLQAMCWHKRTAGQQSLWEVFLQKMAAKTAAEMETAQQSGPSNLVGPEWLEHSTYGLRVRCSTN